MFTSKSLNFFSPKRPNFFETFRAGYGQSTSSVSSSGMQNLNDGKNEEEKNGKKRKRSTDEEEDEQMFNGKKEKTDFLTAIRLGLWKISYILF